jgi:HEAT repeat protein
MRSLQLIQNRLVGPRGLAVLAASVLWTGISLADVAPPDRVEELRQTLRASNPDNVLTQRIQALQGLAEMRRALMLREWGPETGGVAEPVREQLADRFKKEASRLLKYGTDNARLAVMDMLAEMGANLRGPSDPKGITRALAPDLAALLENGPTAQIRQAAARALGVTFPNPGVAVRPLRDLLASSNVEERRTAAHAVVAWLRVANQLTSKSENPGSVQAERSDIIQLGTAVLPLIDIGFTDADPEVRRLAAEAIEQAAAALNKQVPETRTGEQAIDLNLERQRLTSARSELMPFIVAFKQQGANLTKVLRDRDVQVRLHSQRSLEELGKARMRLYHGELPPIAEQGEEGAAAEPLLQTLQTTLPVLTDAIEDSNPDARLGTIETLEAFGPAAEPAIPALVRALADPNPFVRWAAARTLGKLGAVEPTIAVPGLARLLYDPDLGVRLSASLALDRYGPAAKEAVPDLIQATQTTDNEIRVAAMHTLEKIGAGAQPAVPALTAALSDSNAGIRRTAAETLGQLGALAASAEPVLRKALADPDADVRNAAGDALLSIVQPKG